MQVPNVQLYTPTGAQLLTILDSDALNTNFSAVSTAFARESSLTAETANIQLTSTLRGVLVDLSAASANTSLLVTLPVNPAVGDPPCVVILKESGSSANCIVTASDGNTINGILPDNSAYTNQPSLYEAGDSVVFVFLDGIVGWSCLSQSSAAISSGTWSGCGALPWQGQTVVMTASGTSLSVEALQVIGASAVVINGSSGNITIGDSASTFNSVAGPYTLSAGAEAAIVCIGDHAFTVTL